MGVWQSPHMAAFSTKYLPRSTGVSACTNTAEASPSKEMQKARVWAERMESILTNP